jgi:S-(hydroxymethyl)glutathione dehydrogenase/alcohol dehydrogenase
MTMKAAVLRETQKPLSIEEVQVGSPGPHEVRIRTVAAGVCRTDLHFQAGADLHPMPTVLGHESAGVVEEVGAEVRYVEPGDHVITCLSVFCGHCEFCLGGRPALCRKVETRRGPGQPSRLTQNGAVMHQFMDLSSFAEEMLVHEHAVVKIREDMPLDRAALIGCAVTTGLGSVFRTARVEVGATTAVIGCGGVGLSAVQGAAIAGASRVIAVDMLPEKLELARKLGATDLVNAAEGDPVAQVRDLTDGGIDYSFEACGLEVTAEQSFQMLKRGGTATVIGLMPHGSKIEIDGPELVYEKKIQGSNMGSNRFRVEMPRYVDFYLSGKLNLDDMVSRRITLEEVNDAFESLKRGDVARSVIILEE